ncbi:RNA polymerase sigma factor [Membranihabitans marinus]|uniref:RNA polymerase sigma factor n=1 Tax=Membranihabitans marinus TaxID=1227546 RepID=UPI001EFFCEA1|nr:RNA polymerase sigma-70 factor [Membranihabitans marinus]
MENSNKIEKLIDEYYHRIYKFMIAHLKNADIAQDLTQTVFLELIKSNTSLDAIDNYDAYLFSMARNTLFKEFRKMQNSTKLKNQLLNSMQASTDELEEIIYVHDLNYNLEREINKLPQQQKKIYTMSRHEGLTHKQIAQRLDISANTVKNHMVQALKTLRGKYELMIFILSIYAHLI